MAVFAFVFPGQGSQAVGMMAAYGDSGPIRATFTEASDALSQDLWALVADGPGAELNKTVNTQPAMLAAGVAVYRAWIAGGGPEPAVVAGHSLGEYAALVAAGAIAFSDAIRLVRRRAELMQGAVSEGEGAMAAILGLDDDAVRATCSEAASGQVVEAVNFNSPGQVVIAGHAAAVARASEIAKARGAKRVVALPVSVPSHCALMKPAADSLAIDLAAVKIHLPRIPVIQNADADSHRLEGEIRDALARQLFSPVRWVETVRKMAGDGVVAAVECGPGKVLAGLMKRIDERVTALALTDAASFDVVRSAIA